MRRLIHLAEPEIWTAILVVTRYEFGQRIRSRRRLATLTLVPILLLLLPVLIRLVTGPVPTQLADEIATIEIGLAGVTAPLMFVAITLFAGDVLASVVADKSNRVIEVLLSSLRPYQLLVGKILGVGLFGLISFLLLLISISLTLGIVLPLALDVRLSFTLESLGTALLGIYWFLNGFFIFASIYAGLGATVSRTEDINSAVFPVTVLAVFSYLVAYLLAASPLGEETWGQVVAMLPPFAHFAVVALVLRGVLEWYQVLISMLLNLALVPLVIWAAGRLYAGSALASGARMSFRTAWRGRSS